MHLEKCWAIILYEYIQDDSVCLISWIFFLVHFPDFPSVIVFTFPPAGQRTYLHHFKPLAPLRHGSRLLIDPLQHVDQLLVALVALGLLLQELLVLLAALVAHRLVAGVQTHIRLPFFLGKMGGNVKSYLQLSALLQDFIQLVLQLLAIILAARKEKEVEKKVKSKDMNIICKLLHMHTKSSGKSMAMAFVPKDISNFPL